MYKYFIVITFRTGGIELVHENMIMEFPFLINSQENLFNAEEQIHTEMQRRGYFNIYNIKIVNFIRVYDE